MARTTDLVTLDDWYAIDTAAEVGSTPRQNRLLGQDIVALRGEDGGLAAYEVDSSGSHGRPLPVRERYGCLWTSLGDPSRDIVHIAEADEPDRKHVICGWVRIRTSGLRIVENFLDMAHFPFVHTDILGAEPHTEVPHYHTEIRHDVDEVWATNCEFYQPRAAANETSGMMMQLRYRVPSPYVVMLYRISPSQPSRWDNIALFIQPIEEDLCRAQPIMYLADEISTYTDVLKFEQLIFMQDRIILENQRPRLMPLDPGFEIPTRADASSVAYRRWLKQKGLRFGTAEAAVRA